VRSTLALAIALALARLAGAREAKDPCPTFCANNPTPYVGAEAVYLRYAPGSTSYDFLVGGSTPGNSDPVYSVLAVQDITRPTPFTAPGRYLCVNATASRGSARTYTAWVDARCVCACSGALSCADLPPTTGPLPPDCSIASLGGVHRQPDHRPKQVPCTVINPAGATLRLAPDNSALPVLNRRGVSSPQLAHYPCGAVLGQETSPGPNYTARAPVNGFVWVTAKRKRNRTPGRRGWVSLNDVGCADPACVLTATSYDGEDACPTPTATTCDLEPGPRHCRARYPFDPTKACLEGNGWWNYIRAAPGSPFVIFDAIPCLTDADCASVNGTVCANLYRCDAPGDGFEVCTFGSDPMCSSHHVGGGFDTCCCPPADERKCCQDAAGGTLCLP
jgi:hypothetical protein